jgi:hypothetical protein
MKIPCAVLRDSNCAGGNRLDSQKNARETSGLQPPQCAILTYDGLPTAGDNPRRHSGKLPASPIFAIATSDHETPPPVERCVMTAFTPLSSREAAQGAPDCDDEVVTLSSVRDQSGAAFDATTDVQSPLGHDFGTFQLWPILPRRKSLSINNRTS